LHGAFFKLDFLGIADKLVTLAPNLDLVPANSNLKLLQRFSDALSIRKNLGPHPLAGGIKSRDDKFHHSIEIYGQFMEAIRSDVYRLFQKSELWILQPDPIRTNLEAGFVRISSVESLLHTVNKNCAGRHDDDSELSH
jgi:hypothetical protein